MAYEDALKELYQVPLTQFVAERKRLADELKTSGDAAGAKRLVASKRPPISAWVVNQLYWHARDAFDEMLATAEQLRKGHLKASADHRDAIAKLRKRAATILEDAGNAATDATLRRVTTTLSALAATGGFDPDPAGALSADRDPPGFEAVGIPSEPIERPERTERATPKAKAKAKQDDDGDSDGKAELDDAREQAEAQRLAEMAEKKREEDERKRKRAERHKLEAALRAARGNLESQERTLEQLEKQLEKAQKDIADTQNTIGELDARIGELDAE